VGIIFISANLLLPIYYFTNPAGGDGIDVHNVPSIAAVAELELQNFKISTNEQ
jgi:hypothetical protein